MRESRLLGVHHVFLLMLILFFFSEFTPIGDVVSIIHTLTLITWSSGEKSTHTIWRRSLIASIGTVYISWNVRHISLKVQTPIQNYLAMKLPVPWLFFILKHHIPLPRILKQSRVRALQKIMPRLTPLRFRWIDGQIKALIGTLARDVGSILLDRGRPRQFVRIVLFSCWLLVSVSIVLDL